MMKKDNANQKNRRKNKKRPKTKAKVKNTDLASYFAHDENGIPLLTFSPEIEEIFHIITKSTISHRYNKFFPSTLNS